MSRRVIHLIPVLVLAGCAHTTYTKTSGVARASRPADCTFPVKSALPSSSWQEIGVANTYAGDSSPRTPFELYERIRPSVCSAGGELVVGEVNGLGQYILAKVFVRRPDSEQEPRVDDAGGPDTPRGCLYDTQCKGDRICEDGVCRSPARVSLH